MISRPKFFTEEEGQFLYLVLHPLHKFNLWHALTLTVDIFYRSLVSPVTVCIA